MSELVARINRDTASRIDPLAKAARQAYHGRRILPDWDTLSSFDKLPWHEAARAMLDEMRSPDLTLCEVGMEYTGDPCWAKDVGRAFTAMIDFILTGAEREQT